VAHGELVALPEPALDRLPEPVLVLASHVQEGRRARPAVEVLVGAADGQVRAGALEIDGDRADSV
jgi:hypothetical protein